MNKLNLPEFKQPLPLSKSLSMDAYLRFIEIGLRVTGGKPARQHRKEQGPTNRFFFHPK